MSGIDDMTAEDFMAVLHAEWEQRLERNEKEPDVFIRREIQAETGMAPKKALDWMKDLMNAGLADPCFASRKDAWGRIQPTIPAIRFNMTAVRKKLEELDVRQGQSKN